MGLGETGGLAGFGASSGGAVSVGSLANCHALRPPRRAYAFVKPSSCNLSTELALVCSAGHVQYATMKVFFGTSFAHASSLSAGTCVEPVTLGPANVPRVSMMTTF